MKVIIDEKCDRCKREAPKEVDSTEIQVIEEANALKTEQLNKIGQFFESQDQKTMPDLVVWYKGNWKHIGVVCAKFCDKTVRNQIDSMFKEIDVSKRKPRTSKKTEKDEKSKAKDVKKK